ncbi:hypothetical protein MMC27_005672 [Xylographa pallens]|nr:hypothetical protein [Xylographa pallens]
MALASATSVLGQDTTGNPLNVFISLAAGGLTVVETAVATQSTPSASSTSPASAPASTTSSAPAATSTTAAAAASSGGLSHQTLLDIIIPVVVIGVLLLALLALCIYCCLRRRRRSKRTATPVADEEVTTWRRPENPGRTYGPVEPPQIPMSQQPTVPLMATAATAERPYTADHPAFRNPNTENPFVPLPPSPRRTAPNSRVGLTDGMVAGAPAFVDAPYAGASRLRKSRSISRSTSGGGLYDSYGGGPGSPYGNTTTVYPNPYPNAGPVGAGLNDPYDKFDAPAPPAGNYYNKYGELVVPALEHGNNTYPPPTHDRSPPTPANRTPLLPASQRDRDRDRSTVGLSGLNSNPPPSSSSGPQSPYARIGSPYTDMHVHQLQTDRPSLDLLRTDAPIPLPTPAQTRSAHRRPGPTTPPLVPSRSPNRRSQFHDSTYDSFGSQEHAASLESGSASGSGSAESWQTGLMQHPPAAPWEDRERRYSAGSGAGGGRRYSGSPRASLAGGASGAGTPTAGGRRLRFSDVDLEEPGRNVRFSQGVGEAL